MFPTQQEYTPEIDMISIVTTEKKGEKTKEK